MWSAGYMVAFQIGIGLVGLLLFAAVVRSALSGLKAVVHAEISGMREAIKTDVSHLLREITEAKDTAARAHRRLDECLSSGCRLGTRRDDGRM